jgi:hypothetical protein
MNDGRRSFAAQPRRSAFDSTPRAPAPPCPRPDVRHEPLDNRRGSPMVERACTSSTSHRTWTLPEPPAALTSLAQYLGLAPLAASPRPPERFTHACRKDTCSPRRSGRRNASFVRSSKPQERRQVQRPGPRDHPPHARHLDEDSVTSTGRPLAWLDRLFRDSPDQEFLCRTGQVGPAPRAFLVLEAMA